MKIFLSKQCESLTGILNANHGYHIEHRKNGFFSKRNQKGIIPDDGHWRHILLCAQLANNPLYIADIEIHWEELRKALEEAHYWVASQVVRDNGLTAKKLFYNAADIRNLQITFGL